MMRDLSLSIQPCHLREHSIRHLRDLIFVTSMTYVYVTSVTTVIHHRYLIPVTSVTFS